MQVIVLSPRSEVSSPLGEEFPSLPYLDFCLFFPHSHSDLPFYSIICLVHVIYFCYYLKINLNFLVILT